MFQTGNEDIDTADLYAVQQLLRADEEAQEAVGVVPGADHSQAEEGDEEYDEEVRWDGEVAPPQCTRDKASHTGHDPPRPNTAKLFKP